MQRSYISERYGSQGAAIPLEFELNVGGVAAGPAVTFALPALLGPAPEGFA